MVLRVRLLILSTVPKLFRKFDTSSEPNPVASSKPVPTTKPASTPPELVGVLVLHRLIVVALHGLTPLDATVVSWKALGALENILYRFGFRLPWALPVFWTSNAAIPAMPGADAEVPAHSVMYWVQSAPSAAKQPR